LRRICEAAVVMYSVWRMVEFAKTTPGWF
jgi:hypothetical protein